MVSPADPAKPHQADKADPVDTAEAQARDREAQSGKYGSLKAEPIRASRAAAVRLRRFERERGGLAAWLPGAS